MGEYWAHWLEMGKKIPRAPKIFHVNWFRTDDQGHFIWPGFGENMRVLMWILARCEDKVGAKETPIGYVPFSRDINLEGTDVSEKTLEELLSIDRQSWLDDIENIKEFYDFVGPSTPKELREELDALKQRLSK
jgi:phosphoenolpyruvate carboxykinase (GTP)